MRMGLTRSIWMRDAWHRYAGSLLKLKLEFLKRRKKGKLPKEAKGELKTWWLQHILWPYPSVRSIRCVIYVCMGIKP